MIPGLQQVARVVAAAVSALLFSVAHAHSASDAYLTLEMGPPGRSGETIVRGQWDVALRDLDFVLGLDENGDGIITWKELRKRQDAIARYAYGFLQASGDGRACSLRPLQQRVANHADGAYAALSFEIVCTGSPGRLTFDYRMFFAIDPSHRCILLMRSGGEAATALLSPQNARVGLDLQPLRSGYAPAGAAAKGQ